MVFDFDSSTLYKEELRLVRAYAVVKASQLTYNQIAKLFNQIPMIKSVFGALKTEKHLSGTTKSNAGVHFDVYANTFGDKLHIVHTGLKALVM